MANFRQIHVKIWKDNWFLDLDPKEKLLYIYLFSNDLTSLSGIYQISQKVIAFETGLNNQWIAKALSSFQSQGKIEYEDGYIWLKKLRKYHETSSHTVQIRIKNDLDNIPDIPLKTQYIAYYDPDIPYRYPIDTDPLKEEEEKEYKKEEEVKKKTKSSTLTTDELLELAPLPEEFAFSLEFASTWTNFIEHRIEIGKPFKKRGAEMALSRLAKYELDIAIAAMQDSISNGWQGLFPDKVDIHNGKGISRKSQAELRQEASDKNIKDIARNIMEDE